MISWVLVRCIGNKNMYKYITLRQYKNKHHLGVCIHSQQIDELIETFYDDLPNILKNKWIGNKWRSYRILCAWWMQLIPSLNYHHDAFKLGNRPTHSRWYCEASNPLYHNQKSIQKVNNSRENKSRAHNNLIIIRESERSDFN